MPFHVGIAEDDPRMRATLVQGLRAEGLEVTVSAGSGREFLEALRGQTVDVAVLDIGLPDCDGRDLCLAMRGQGLDIPVLLLTARDEVVDRLQGFSAGADDYLAKPFAFAELVARVSALARRHTAHRHVDGIRLDPLQYKVVASGPLGVHGVSLSPTEFRLLSALMARTEQVVRRRALVASAWPDGGYVADNTLDSYIRRIRRKLRELEVLAGLDQQPWPQDSLQDHEPKAGERPAWSMVRIVTVHGIGYRVDLRTPPGLVGDR